MGIMLWKYHEHRLYSWDNTFHLNCNNRNIQLSISLFRRFFLHSFFSFLSLNENFGGFWRKIDFKISFWSDLKNFSIFNWKIIDIEMGKALPNKRMAKIFTLPWRVRFWNNYRIRTQLLSQTVAMTPSRSCDRFYEAFMKDMKFSFLS